MGEPRLYGNGETDLIQKKIDINVRKLQNVTGDTCLADMYISSMINV